MALAQARVDNLQQKLNNTSVMLDECVAQEAQDALDDQNNLAYLKQLVYQPLLY